MTKLDWSRASERTLDPARVQRSNVFLPPDSKPKSKPKKRKVSGPPTPAQIRKQAAHAERMKAIQDEKKKRKLAAKSAEAERQKLNAAAKTVRAAKTKEQRAAAAEKMRIKKAEQTAMAKTRRAAFAEYQKTPEYAAKVARDEAKMAAKKKSHLQVWIEEKTGLGADRQSLREMWRDRLLGRSRGPE